MSETDRPTEAGHEQNCPALIFDGDDRAAVDESKCLCRKKWNKPAERPAVGRVPRYEAGKLLSVPDGWYVTAAAYDALAAQLDECTAQRNDFMDRFDHRTAERDTLAAKLEEKRTDLESFAEHHAATEATLAAVTAERDAIAAQLAEAQQWNVRMRENWAKDTARAEALQRLVSDLEGRIGNALL